MARDAKLALLVGDPDSLSDDEEEMLDGAKRRGTRSGTDLGGNSLLPSAVHQQIPLEV